jgi:hypothetical protein
MLEKDLEKILVRRVESVGGRCLKWVCPGNSGVPDRVCLFPGGLVIFAELKRPVGGVRDPLQRVWARRVRALGFLHYWIENTSDIDVMFSYVRAWKRLVDKGYRVREAIIDERD